MWGLWALLIALLLGFLVLQFHKQLQSYRRYPPGPLPLPVIGGIWRLAAGLNHHILIKLAKQYGNICTLWVGNIPVVMLSGFQAVKEGLINHSEDFADRPTTPFFTSLFKGRGIVFSNGHNWKQQRRFGLVTLRKLGLGKKGLEHQIQDIAQQLVETFARTKGQPLDPSLPITNSVCNVISVLAFGHPFSTEDKDFQNLVEAIHILATFITGTPHALYEMFPWLMKHLPGPHQKALKVIETSISFAKKEAEQHREHLSLHEPQDFIDFYLLQMERSKNDPDSTYDDVNLAYSVFELFGAGTETTAVSLKWALLFMATHPDIQDRVHKEIEDVFGSSYLISYQDRKKLPYTNAVIHEIQRVKYGFLFGLPRQCVKDVNVLGCFIPKGTVIAPDLRSVLLDPKQWETPEKFNPNHFLDKEGRFVDREEFLAFGAGHRVCLGEQMARIEIFIFLITLLRAFTLQIPEGVKELNQEPMLGITTHPHPYKICFIPRCSA